ncbi:MAG TPA: carbohydrate kinase [Oscillatoriaceae cyanobacterium]
MAGLLTVGEALYDWVSTDAGADLASARHFVKAPGGAPLNVAVGAARLGVETAFAGRVGDDPFGHALLDLLVREGVDTRLARVAAERQTRMAYVLTREDGDRHLAGFSTVACADAALTPEDLPESAITDARAFYFGALMLADPHARAVMLDAARRAHAGEGLVVFDPNWRLVMWPDADELRAVVDEAIATSHLLKLGDDELSWLTGLELEAGANALFARHDLAALVVTCGAQGCYFKTARAAGHVPSYAVRCVDATGAGDGFVAGLLAGLLARDDGMPMPAQVRRLDGPAWHELLTEANAVGALATTQPGAVSALPRREALDNFLATRR